MRIYSYGLMDDFCDWMDGQTHTEIDGKLPCWMDG